MAKVVEDIDCESGSEDEFPSLQELVATRGQRAFGRKAKSTLHPTCDGEGGTRVRSPVKSTVGSRGTGKEEETARTVKAQPRKRVLNQKSDNPLLRPFDSASSELLGKEAGKKGRGLVGKMGKKSGVKRAEEEAGQEEEKGDAIAAQRKDSGFVETGESEVENLDPARSLKKDWKTTRTRLDLKAREGKATARSPSKLMKSIEENYSDSVAGNKTKVSKGKKLNNFDDGEREGATEAETTHSTAVESIASEDEDVKQATKPINRRQVRKAAEKPRATHSQRFELEEEDFGLDSDGLSDFIVDDSSFLEKEETIIEEPAPRSVRKLVKGRRPNRIENSDDEELDVRMGKLKMTEDSSNTLDKALKELNLEDSDDDDLVDIRKKKNDRVLKQPKEDKEQPASSDIEDPFTLRYSPSMNKPIKLPKETRFATPPGSPILKPQGLVSPKKKVPRIPSTPHRPSMDSFWQQDVVNDWNDEYSPRKVILPQAHFTVEDSDSIDPVPLLGKSPLKTAEVKKESKKCFDLRKRSLAEKFVLELDTKVTNGEITRLSQETGGVRIIWSKTLQSTAGRAIWRRESIRTASNPHVVTYRHHASIELAEKVIDDENRLFNTVAHEFCHLTTYMIDNVKTNPHGKNFKAWGAKVTDMFRDLEIEVSTKHSYAIDYKYIWKCEKCGSQFKRHSKSIDPTRQSCSCNDRGRLIQIKPAPKSLKGSDGKEKTLTEYQLFVKQNMSKVKQANPGSPQKEIMSLVGKSYKEYKASKLNGDAVTVKVVDALRGTESRQVTPEEDRAAFVSRKLNFLDLTMD